MSAKGFGERVLKARLEMGARRGTPVTQKEVADALGVTSATVGRWEANLKQPTLESIEALARFLSASPGYLAFGAAEVEQRLPLRDMGREPEGAQSDDATPYAPPERKRRNSNAS
jgi:transcriptional regulator with XRE-family HTH domain